jgi:hypothetical protein
VALTQPPGAYPPATSSELKSALIPILVLGLPSSGVLPEADLYIGALRHLETVPPGKAVLAVGSSGASMVSRPENQVTGLFSAGGT